MWFVQNHRRDLRPGYDHLLRYLGAAQAIIAFKPAPFRRCYGSEFTSRAILKWADENEVPWHYIDPDRPQQNAYVERYNRTVRHEWLALYIFESIEEVQQIATEWLWSYNHERPNMGNGGMTPAQKLKMAA